MNWNRESYHKPFSHIYVEDRARNHPLTEMILKRFSDAQIISISNYMEVFSSHRQDFVAQKNSQKLILAVKELLSDKDTLVYPGSPVCQDFGHHHFYYTSSIMNCPYDCEYCYLQGMYPSSHMVLFLNLGEIFQQVEALLQQHPVYLCISYDTDLLALEGLTGYVSRWIDFAEKHPTLTIECRTKSAAIASLPDTLSPALSQRFILAWTLSPASVIERYEHHTPSLDTRLTAICQALERGYRIRLCFDPMLRIPDWRGLYHDLFHTVFRTIQQKYPNALSNGQIADISLGTFRISREYLGQMRRNRPDSLLIQYPFQSENGFCSYGSGADQEMMEYAISELNQWISKENIFFWK